MGKKVSNALPRIFTAISFCFVAIAAPLINSINAFAALPEGLVVNDDNDTPHGAINTSSEISIDGGWKINSSNLYSGKIEPSKVRLKNLNIANANLIEYVSEYNSDFELEYHLVTNAADKCFEKYTTPGATSVVYNYCEEVYGDGSLYWLDHAFDLIFSNAIELVDTGEEADLKVSFREITIATPDWSADVEFSKPFGFIDDYASSGYSSLLIGASNLVDESHPYPIGVDSSVSFTALKPGTSTPYNKATNFLFGIADLDMRDFSRRVDSSSSCPMRDSWENIGGFVESFQLISGVDKRLYTIENSGVGFMPDPYTWEDGRLFAWGNGRLTDGTLQCSDVVDDPNTLRTAVILSGNFSAGVKMDAVKGSLGTQKTFFTSLTFPKLKTAAGDGGAISDKDKLITRNFGETYVVTVTPDEEHYIKKILIKDLNTNATISEFSLTDFLDDSAAVPGSVVLLDNGIRFKYKGDGVVNVILPEQYALKRGEIKQSKYDDYLVTATFTNGEDEPEPEPEPEPIVPNTSDAGTVENPNTADVIYLPVIMLGAAVAVLAYRKRRQI